MDVRFTPHLGVAALIVVVAIAIAVGPLTTGAGDHPRAVTEMKVREDAKTQAMLTASAALAPLDPTCAAAIESDPFTLRERTVARRTRLPVPPPPPLTPPDPVVLPLPPEAQP